MFRARRKLSDPGLRSTAVFSVRELALLADMSEGAVRNALSAKGVASRREESKVVVEWAEASVWLRKKRGFRPTPDAAHSPHTDWETAATLKTLLAALTKFPGAENILLEDWWAGQWSGNLGEV